MYGGHIVLFWLSFAAYGAEAGLSLSYVRFPAYAFALLFVTGFVI